MRNLGERLRFLLRCLASPLCGEEDSNPRKHEATGA